MNDGDLVTLQHMLGHKSLATTSIYLHLVHDFNNLKGTGMTKNKPTVQDIFILYGPNYIKNHKLAKEQLKVISSIMNYKTKEMRIHKITCEHCGEKIIGYNSCRNRHCPMCQQYKKRKMDF